MTLAVTLLAAPSPAPMRPAPITHAGEEGFSLIEALVALAVLAIATVGLIGTVEAHVNSTRGLELRAVAMLVAENQLAELSVPGMRDNAGQVEMLDRQWRVQVTRRATDDPEIQRVHIEVSPAPTSGQPQGAGRNGGAFAVLDGFVDEQDRESRQ